MSRGNICNINKFRCYAVQDALCLEIKCMGDMLWMSIFGGQEPLTQLAIHPLTLHVLWRHGDIQGFCYGLHTYPHQWAKVCSVGCIVFTVIISFH